MADIHPSPVPSAMGPALDGPGPEFPSASAGVMAAANTAYSVPGVGYGAPGVEVMGSASGGPLQESGYAHDVNAGPVAPYSPGAVFPIYVGGDADAGGRDTVAGTVAAAVATAQARYLEHVADTFPQGSTIGDLLGLPPYGTGGTVAGGPYDPPREY